MFGVFGFVFVWTQCFDFFNECNFDFPNCSDVDKWFSAIVFLFLSAGHSWARFLPVALKPDLTVGTRSTWRVF